MIPDPFQNRWAINAKCILVKVKQQIQTNIKNGTEKGANKHQKSIKQQGANHLEKKVGGGLRGDKPGVRFAPLTHQKILRNTAETLHKNYTLRKWNFRKWTFRERKHSAYSDALWAPRARCGYIGAKCPPGLGEQTPPPWGLWAPRRCRSKQLTVLQQNIILNIYIYMWSRLISFLENLYLWVKNDVPKQVICF